MNFKEDKDLNKEIVKQLEKSIINDKFEWEINHSREEYFDI